MTDCLSDRGDVAGVLCQGEPGRRSLGGRVAPLLGLLLLLAAWLCGCATQSSAEAPTPHRERPNGEMAKQTEKERRAPPPPCSSASAQGKKEFAMKGLDDRKSAFLILQNLPLRIAHLGGRESLAVVLVLGADEPFSRTFSDGDVKAELADGNVVVASHVAIGPLWTVGMEPPEGRDFLHVSSSRALSMCVDGREVQINPTYAAALNGGVSAKFNKGGEDRVIWFIFPIDAKKAGLVNRFRLGDIALEKSTPASEAAPVVESTIISADPASARAIRVVPSLESKGRRRAPKSLGIPEMNPDQMWLSSVPLGLKVYLAPVAVDGSFAQMQKRSMGNGWISTERSHPAVDKAYYRGETPVLLERVPPGHYLLAVVQKQSPATLDPTLKTIVLVSSDLSSDWGKKFRAGDLEEPNPVIYLVKKEPDHPSSIVVSAVDLDQSIVELRALYPDGQNFVFDEDRLRAELNAHPLLKGIDPKQLDLGVDLLRRGGKATIRNASMHARVTVELRPAGMWSLTSQIQLAHGGASR